MSKLETAVRVSVALGVGIIQGGSAKVPDTSLSARDWMMIDSLNESGLDSKNGILFEKDDESKIITGPNFASLNIKNVPTSGNNVIETGDAQSVTTVVVTKYPGY